MAPSFLGKFHMDIADIFLWFAQDSKDVAEHTDEPRQRDVWTKLAELWSAAAERSRGETAGTNSEASR